MASGGKSHAGSSAAQPIQRQRVVDVHTPYLSHQDSSRDSGAGSFEDNSYEYEQCTKFIADSAALSGVELECEVVNSETQHTIACHTVHRDIVRKKKTYKSVPPGTCILLHIRASYPCYVYIFNKGSSGKINLLIPNEDDTTINFIPADKTFLFPPPEADYEFEMDENCGTEIIEVYAFTERVPFDGNTTPDSLQECFRDVVLKKKETKKIAHTEKRKGFLELQFTVQ